VGGRRRVAGVRVLGAVQCVAPDGSLVDLPSVSQRRLLAILALHSPRRLRSEWLADLMGVSPGALRTSVSRLRSAIGTDALETASTGYALVTDVDATQFCAAVRDAADAAVDERAHALERALSTWNGPALEEFRGEAWADGEIARLTEIHAGTVDDYADELISARAVAEAVALLERQIAMYPYRDRSRGLLIRALASGGRQADALRAFQQYWSLLTEEIGTEPSPEVVRIERRVATGWDGIGTGPDGRPVAERASDAAESLDALLELPLPSALFNEQRFVGRAAELEVLASELAAVSATGLRGVVLEGEPGIGKTTLLTTFAQSVARSGAATVLYGGCDETTVPLQPFRSVLSACVEHAPLAVLTEHVARCGGELVRICPALATRVATAPSPTDADDATERFLTFEAAADLLRRIAASRPLLLMLDDLQWAEPTALLMLRHLVRALADAPVLLVSSSRDPGAPESDELRLALADVTRGETRRLHLAGFDDTELADLLSVAMQGVSGAESKDAADTLRDETAGNPLYASQLIRYWVESGRFETAGRGVRRVTPANDAPDVPRSLRDVVWSRVRALGDDASEVLAAASVLGLEFDEDVLVDVVDLREAVVVDALDATAGAGLVVGAASVGRSRRFVHGLVAHALYSDLGPSRRARLHERAARALQKRFEVVPADVVVQLARHCELGGLLAEAQFWSTRAGDDAFEHLAPIEAAQHYRVALDMAIALDRPDADRADLLVRLGDAQHRSGVPEALETLEEGAELALRSGADGALIRAAIAADRGFMRLDNRAPEYLAIVEAAVAVADPTDIATYARLLALLGQSVIYTPDAQRRLALAQQALDLATDHDDPTLLARIASAVLCALWAPDTQELRTQVAASAVASAEASGDPGLVFSAYVAAYNVAIETADHVTAARSLAKMRACASGLGAPFLRWTAGHYDVFEATMGARFAEAEAVATANLDLGMQIGAPDAFTFFAGQLFVIGTFAGRHDELFPLVEQAAKDNPGVLAFNLAYGIICEAVGRDDEAREILHEGMAHGFAELPVDNFWTTSIIGYSVLAIQLEDAAAAAQLLPLILPFASGVAFNGVTSQGPIAAYVGKLASLVGLHDVGEEHLLGALATATAFGWEYHRATTLFALAQSRYRRLGALDAEGRAWLSQASDMCRTGGFRSWVPPIDALAAR
jgi:predicted ATPase/DNA-binding SARP family transcriptional activator